MSYSPWSRKEPDTTEWLTLTHIMFCPRTPSRTSYLIQLSHFWTLLLAVIVSQAFLVLDDLDRFGGILVRRFVARQVFFQHLCFLSKLESGRDTPVFIHFFPSFHVKYFLSPCSQAELTHVNRTSPCPEPSFKVESMILTSTSLSLADIILIFTGFWKNEEGTAIYLMPTISPNQGSGLYYRCFIESLKQPCE